MAGGLSDRTLSTTSSQNRSSSAVTAEVTAFAYPRPRWSPWVSTLPTTARRALRETTWVPAADTRRPLTRMPKYTPSAMVLDGSHAPNPSWYSRLSSLTSTGSRRSTGPGDGWNRARSTHIRIIAGPGSTLYWVATAGRDSALAAR